MMSLDRTARPPATWRFAVVDAVLGREPVLRERTRQQLLTVPLALAGMALLVYARAIYPVPPGLWWAWQASVLAWNVLAYALVRSRWSERLQEPALLAWQIAYGMASASWAYVMVGPYRPLVIPIMLVILIYCMFELSAKVSRALAIWSQVCLGVGCLVGVFVWPGDFDPRTELLHWVVMLICVSAVTVLIMQMARIRLRLEQQHRDLNAALSRIEHLATHDELTGLVNRRHGSERLRVALARHLRSGDPLCLALLDIDHFKRFNDAHGHAVGDAVLVAFAAAAQQALRGTDLLVRWGGEEFLLIMEGSELAAAQAGVERLREAVRRATVPGVQGQPLGFAFSGGIAQAQRHADIAALLEQADRALYRAKAGGRDRVLLGEAE